MKFKEFWESIRWALIVAVIATLPIFVSLIVSLIDKDHDVNLDKTLIGGSLLIVALSIASAAWVDANFPQRPKDSFGFKAFVHIFFVMILIFSLSTYPTLLSNNRNIDLENLKTISLIILVFSFAYSAISKYIMIKSDSNNKMKSTNPSQQNVEIYDTLIKGMNSTNAKIDKLSKQQIEIYHSLIKELNSDKIRIKRLIQQKRNREIIIKKLTQVITKKIGRKPGDSLLRKELSKEQLNILAKLFK